MHNALIKNPQNLKSHFGYLISAISMADSIFAVKMFHYFNKSSLCLYLEMT